MNNNITNYAAIDIGSNTILMVIAEANSNRNFKILTDEHAIARLGEKVDQTKIIKEEAIERAVAILKNYKEICKKFKVNHIKAVATSAVRDCDNKNEVVEKLSEAIGSKIEVITGDEEATLSFKGTIESGKSATVLDIGGGSTEIITGINGQIQFKKSVQIGAVRITEKIFSSHPPSFLEIEKAKEFISQEITKIDNDIVLGELYSVAGTPTTLAAVVQNLKEYDNRKVHLFKLDIKQLESIFIQFVNLSVDEIISNYNIHPKRADVITAGTLILIETMKYLNRDYSIVSANGLRYGVLYSMAGLK